MATKKNTLSVATSPAPATKRSPIGHKFADNGKGLCTECGRENKQHAGRKAIPGGETPDARFVRLARTRLSKALVAIKGLGNLAAPARNVTDDNGKDTGETTGYTSTDSQRAGIFAKLRSAIDSAESEYAARPKGDAKADPTAFLAEKPSK